MKPTTTQCMECIRVISAEMCVSDAVRQHRELARYLRDVEEELGVPCRLYICHPRATDFMVTLTWPKLSNESISQGGSHAGCSIAEYLETYGLVDHVIWKEEASR